MRFRKARLKDVALIELEPIGDERGYFARTFCKNEFSEAGLSTEFVQQSFSHTLQAGAIRGMHFQREPYAEVKLIRCIAGAIYDVLIDLRPGSPTYMQWESFELTDHNGLQLYVPAGLAHGFQTLAPASSVGYMMTVPHMPAAATGVRYDDRAFQIDWPLAPTAISERDRNWPDFTPVDQDTDRPSSPDQPI